MLTFAEPSGIHVNIAHVTDGVHFRICDENTRVIKGSRAVREDRVLLNFEFTILRQCALKSAFSNDRHFSARRLNGNIRVCTETHHQHETSKYLFHIHIERLSVRTFRVYRPPSTDAPEYFRYIRKFFDFLGSWEESRCCSSWPDKRRLLKSRLFQRSLRRSLVILRFGVNGVGTELLVRIGPNVRKPPEVNDAKKMADRILA